MNGTHLESPHFDVDPVTNNPIITEQFIHDLMNHFDENKLLAEQYLESLLVAATVYFTSLPTLIHVTLPPKLESMKYGGDKQEEEEEDDDALKQEDDNNGPPRFTVVGDLHGQYLDLCEIFRIQGLPSPSNYFLFNGDFVDRGTSSYEIMCLLLSLKLRYPEGVHLLRGNHEDA